MLAMSEYSSQYVAQCRARVTADVAAFNALAAVAAGDALAALEAAYFRNALIALDAHFVHRLRGAEGKDGNPLNEVRMLTNALMTGVPLAVDKTIRYAAAKAVLKLEIGQPVRLSAGDFEQLAAAFLDEIERRYVK